MFTPTHPQNAPPLAKEMNEATKKEELAKRESQIAKLNPTLPPQGITMLSKLNTVPKQMAQAFLDEDALKKRSYFVMSSCKDPVSHNSCYFCLNDTESAYREKYEQTLKSREKKQDTWSLINHRALCAKAVGVMYKCHHKWELHPLTIHVAVSLFHRYMSQAIRDKNEVSETEAVDLGMTALFLGCKLEEIYFPPASEFIRNMVHNKTAQGLYDKERKILNALSYDMFPATCLHFLQLYSSANKSSDAHFCLSLYISDLCLAFIVGFKPSMVAAAILAISNHMKERGVVWTPGLAVATGYKLADMTACMNTICQMFNNTNDDLFMSIRSTYQCTAYHNVGGLTLLSY